MSNRVYIFDTTLRDGEQSPGCSMTVPEKLRMARKLVELGVDILEAGFPIASDGDFEAVRAVSREFRVGRGGGTRPRLHARRRARRPRARRRPTAAHPHLHRHQRHPPEVQAEEDARSRCSTTRWRPSSWRAATSTTWSSRPRTRRAPTRRTWRRCPRRWWRPARARSTSPTRSATRCPTSSPR